MNCRGRCFAYVGYANDPRTWELPYRRGDGTVDAKRLPKAIQALLSNHRGAKVNGLPEPAIAHILTTLACAADEESRMPPKATSRAPISSELAQVLKQLRIASESL